MLVFVLFEFESGERLTTIAMWFVEKIEITGGFLPGLSVQLPQGLTCIIGPRGSGKINAR
jgi:hypothetical protein